METFAEWLQHEMDERSWNQSETARQAGVKRATINRLLNGTRGIGPETCAHLAKALGYPPEIVMRAAGLLPPAKRLEDRPVIQRVIEAAWDLPDDEWAELLAIVLVKQEKMHKASTGSG